MICAVQNMDSIPMECKTTWLADARWRARLHQSFYVLDVKADFNGRVVVIVNFKKTWWTNILFSRWPHPSQQADSQWACQPATPWLHRQLERIDLWRFWLHPGISHMLSSGISPSPRIFKNQSAGEKERRRLLPWQGQPAQLARVLPCTKPSCTALTTRSIRSFPLHCPIIVLAYMFECDGTYKCELFLMINSFAEHPFFVAVTKIHWACVFCCSSCSELLHTPCVGCMQKACLSLSQNDIK